MQNPEKHLKKFTPKKKSFGGKFIILRTAVWFVFLLNFAPYITAFAQLDAPAADTSADTDAALKSKVEGETKLLPSGQPKTSSSSTGAAPLSRSSFAFYEVKVPAKRVLAVSKVPQPGFDTDQIVYLIDRSVSTVIGRARITKASISSSTSQHFLELNILEPKTVNTNAPLTSWEGQLVVLEETLTKDLSHLKWARGVNKSLLGSNQNAAILATNRLLNKSPPANSLVGLELLSDTRPYYHLATLTGISGSIQGLGFGAALSVFPPKSKNLGWINWFGLGFESSIGTKSTFEGQNGVTLKKESFEISATESKAVLWIRPNFDLSFLSRSGLKIVPWRETKQSLKSMDSPTVLETKTTGVQLSIMFESNPFSTVVFGISGDIPIKQKQSLKSTNSGGSTSESSADLTQYRLGVEAGFREPFGSDKNIFVLEGHAGSNYNWETFVTPTSEETSPKRFLPYGNIGFGYLLR